MGPGALWHRGALGFFGLAKNVWHKPFHFRDRMARGLCASTPAVIFKLSAAQRAEQLFCTLPCAVTLPGSKVACLSRWRHAPLQEWADGLCPHSCLPSGALAG